MKNFAVQESRSIVGKKLAGSKLLVNYVLNPIKSGIFGFSAFFSILLITKLFSYWIGTYNEFTIDLDDVLLSVIGFILVFLIKFLENFKQEES